MAASSHTTIPGFSAEQINSIAALIDDVLDKALDKRFGPLQPQQKQAVTVLQPAQSCAEKQKSLLQQANSEIIAKKAVNSSHTITVNTGLVPVILYQRAMQYGRDAPLIGSRNAPPLACFFASLLASLPGYIRFAEDMEATGQG